MINLPSLQEIRSDATTTQCVDDQLVNVNIVGGHIFLWIVQALSACYHVGHTGEGLSLVELLLESACPLTL